MTRHCRAPHGEAGPAESLLAMVNAERRLCGFDAHRRGAPSIRRRAVTPGVSGTLRCSSDACKRCTRTHNLLQNIFLSAISSRPTPDYGLQL